MSDDGATTPVEERAGAAAGKAGTPDEGSVERPAFAEKFPADPELTRLLEAFNRGDYAAVRSGAPRLAQATKDPAVKSAALELRRRIDPDPVSSALLLIAAVLLALVGGFYLSHAHEDAPANAPPPAPQPSSR